MKKLILLAFALAATICLATSLLRVDELVKNSSQYDKKTVSVEGVVGRYQERTSRKGNRYTTFMLKGGGKVASAYTQGTPELKLKDGDKVIVTGLFQKLKVIKSFKIENEIDFTAKAGKGFGVKVTK